MRFTNKNIISSTADVRERGALHLRVVNQIGLGARAKGAYVTIMVAKDFARYGHKFSEITILCTINNTNV